MRLHLVVLALMMSVLIMSIPVQAQNQARAGSVTPLATANLQVEHFRTGADGKEAWRVAIPGGRPLATPAVVNGTVYVGGGFGSYEFYAFDAQTGKPRWAIRVSDDGPTAAVVDEGVVAFNTESCTLFVVDAATGRPLWSRWLGDPLMGQPAISGGRVFMAFPSDNGHYLVALGLRNGREHWRGAISGDVISAPIVYQDSVYVTTFDGFVYRFHTADGRLVWKKDFRATSAPWLYQGQVFVSQREVGNDTGTKKVPQEGIARMDSSSGQQNQRGGAWRKRDAPYLSPEIQKGSSYYTAQKGNDSAVGFSQAPATAKITAAERNVGQSTVQGLWEYQGSRPVVIGRMLFLTQGDQVVALSTENGSQLWVHNLSGDLEKIGGHLAAPPSAAGGKLYLATATGQVMVLSQNDGKLLETIGLASAMRFQPSIADGRMFVGSAAGTLLSVKLKDASATGWTMWGGGPSHNGN